VIAAAGADVYSTHVALQRGGLESNPMLGSEGAQVLLKAAVTSVALYECHQWEQEGHRNRARVVRYSLIVLWGSAAAWNLSRGGRR
jgi:hypothetical protein